MKQDKSPKFKYSKVLLPVIHVESWEQAEKNLEICKGTEADGVFLISHSLNDRELLKIAKDLKLENPNYWMGINLLGMKTTEAFWNADFMDAIWVDNAFTSDCEIPKHEAGRMMSFLYNREKPSMFGGVAFKYQPKDENLQETCRLAQKFVDVITTSGDKTGQPPTLQKIKELHSYVGDVPLAIASGITYDNVEQFLPYVNYFLVSTGISKSFAELDGNKVSELAKKIHAGYQRKNVLPVTPKPVKYVLDIWPQQEKELWEQGTWIYQEGQYQIPNGTHCNYVADLNRSIPRTNWVFDESPYKTIIRQLMLAGY